MNKIILQKGLRLMSFFIVFCFIGPFVVHQAFQNKTHPLYYPVLILGVLLLTLSLYIGFKGIRTLVNALLGERKKKQF
ncbi:MAG: hypothetical protein ACI9TK_001352 [Flavobacteriaceae bacterium]|jgi:hypothetical protein|tara:strand:+ start:4510 stop:4743 length:234 start_codon:yes stop_codon:yes gene_type:complete